MDLEVHKIFLLSFLVLLEFFLDYKKETCCSLHS